MSFGCFRTDVATDIRNSVECMAGTTQNISNLVSNQFFNPRSSWAEVFARIEFLRRFPKRLSYSSSHGESEVSVDVNFCTAESTGDFDVRFRHASRVFPEFAAVFVNLMDEVFRNAGSPVENQWIIAQARI